MPGRALMADLAHRHPLHHLVTISRSALPVQTDSYLDERAACVQVVFVPVNVMDTLLCFTRFLASGDHREKLL
jgi:hypothetical protein